MVTPLQEALIAQYLPLLLPGGPCATMQLETGDYPGTLLVDQEVKLEAFGGPVVIGAQ